jgi:hypothetical protein
MINYRNLGQLAVSLLVIVFSFINRTSAQETEVSYPNVDIYGDYRFRIEDDWGAHESDGDDLEGRTRARVRVRLGATYFPNEHISLGLRVRSGLIEGQQVANITVYDFEGNNTGDADFLFDKWYMEYQTGGLSSWIGRNSIPYWKQNELYWDDDVIPVGFGINYTVGIGSGKFEVNGGLFSLPAGMQAFSGRVLLGQIVYQHKINSIRLTAAAGVQAIAADRDDPDREIFLDNNGNRDYTLWQGNIQAKIESWKIPLQIGFDLSFNSEKYEDAPSESFTEFHKDEVAAYVFSAFLGTVSDPGDWQVGYSYAYIEMFGVNNSFSQDDWVRWGTAEQVRDSNFMGHEFRGVVALPLQLSVMIRFYKVDGIKLRSPDSVQKEDGNRFRIDLNYKF